MLSPALEAMFGVHQSPQPYFFLLFLVLFLLLVIIKEGQPGLAADDWSIPVATCDPLTPAQLPKSEAIVQSEHEAGYVHHSVVLSEFFWGWSVVILISALI